MSGLRVKIAKFLLNPGSHICLDESKSSLLIAKYVLNSIHLEVILKMRKRILWLFLTGILVLLTMETKAQQPVSQSERRTVIKALETKIAELEVKRAVDLPRHTPELIDEQLVNLRKRLAELIGKPRSVTTKRNLNNSAVARNKRRPKI